MRPSKKTTRARLRDVREPLRLSVVDVFGLRFNPDANRGPNAARSRKKRAAGTPASPRYGRRWARQLRSRAGDDVLSRRPFPSSEAHEFAKIHGEMPVLRLS